MKCLSRIFALALLASITGTVFAGKIVVNHDEWTLSNTGFSQSPDTAVFTENIASFFTGGSAGTFHAYSANFGLVQLSLLSTMTGAGHTYTTGTAISFDLGALLGFDAIFVAGPATGLSTSVLVDYVNAGGNVYLAGGTGGFGSATAEANFWNAFLNPFGMAFLPTFNGIGGNISVQPSPHEIFDGVSTLFQNNGNTVELVVNDPNASVFFNGRYAVYDDTASVPEPGILGMFTAGLMLLGFRRRHKCCIPRNLTIRPATHPGPPMPLPR